MDEKSLLFDASVVKGSHSLIFTLFDIRLVISQDIVIHGVNSLSPSVFRFLTCWFGAIKTI